VGACDEAFGVSLGETAPSADLGFCVGILDESYGLGASGLDPTSGCGGGHTLYEDRPFHRPQRHHGYFFLHLFSYCLLFN